MAHPSSAIARRRAMLIQEVDQVCYIKRVNDTIAVGVAGTKGIRYRRGAIFVQIINQIGDIKRVKTVTVVGITRFSVAYKNGKILPESGVQLKIGGSTRPDSSLADSTI